MTTRYTFVPDLPVGFGFDSLRAYLAQRAGDLPTTAPAPVAIAHTTASGIDVDVLTWTYAQPTDFNGAIADGFLLYSVISDVEGTGTSTTPSQSIVKLSISARSHAVVVPHTLWRSYAIAAYRQTQIGELAGALQQIAAWRGYVGA